MAKYSRSSQKTVESAMHRMKKGKLKSSSGDKVKNPKQAIAIGLSEAREKGAKVPPPKKTAKKKTAKKAAPVKKRAAKKAAPAKKSTAKKTAPKKSAKKAAAKKAAPAKKRAAKKLVNAGGRKPAKKSAGVAKQGRKRNTK